ncbi:response regulator transcription factor [Saccharopolyspora sp. ASAGF58]|uniref:response regulator transcription factor n=1 Tax=Saccharopolyspora sp. ASAGF58 TaxID=2719023 RepID=UPI00143FDAEE|nr:response regulator transcription factor [Saccharopolyspora sp. ASAGF58]QIZ37447.1 response regulator transcription factor [Saccharopolyspora sp. ASAGF58]
MFLLIVEDDDRVASALTAVLDRHGFDTDRARSGAQALEALSGDPDLVLLDLGLPDTDGFELCRQIRQRFAGPILIVTARTDTRARIHGLNLGADDYVVKPYDVGELIARIHAVARRSEPRRNPVTRTRRAGPISVDVDTREVTVDEVPVQLTRKEFDLLAMLARQPGVVFTREQILSEVWSTHWQGSQRTLEVHVASLRAKLGIPDAVQTVRGVGYRLRP